MSLQRQIDQKRTNANVTKILTFGTFAAKEAVFETANTSGTTSGGFSIDIKSFNNNTTKIQDPIALNPVFGIPIVNVAVKYGQMVSVALQFVLLQNLMPNVIYVVGSIADLTLRPITNYTSIKLSDTNIQLSGTLSTVGAINIIVPTPIPQNAGSILNFNFTFAV